MGIYNDILIAKGEQKAPLVLKNAAVLDVFSEMYRKCDVAISGEKIVGIGEYEGEKEINLEGKYLIPGLIDSHVHIESSYLTPTGYAAAVLPHGVTTVIADPHEIANACGENGIEYMINSAEKVPLDVHFMLPSCVPATPFEHSGAVIDAAATKRLMEKYKFAGLGEMMNYPGLLGGDDEVLCKLSCAGMIDGHAPELRGKPLCAYASAGINTDHECLTADEAKEKISMGMYIHLREGTLAKDVAALVPAITPENVSRFTFCTDDKHIDDIIKNGTVNDAIRVAVNCGIKPETAIRMATINAAECYHLYHTGAVAPGYTADLAICSDPAAQNVVAVYKSGIKAAGDGERLFELQMADSCAVSNSVNIKPLGEERLTAPFSDDQPVIKVNEHSLITGRVYTDTAEKLSQVAVIERYKASGNIGRAYVSGLDIRGGAVAQTIGHDSHNIIVLGDNETDMRTAVETLGKSGGIAVASGGECRAFLKLEIGGLMTDEPPETAVRQYEKLKKELERLCGDNAGENLMSLAFLPLLVIPELKISDSGLFDVNSFSFI